MATNKPTTNNPFSTEQWAQLLAVADTFIPALSDDEIEETKSFAQSAIINPKWGVIDEFLHQSAADCVEFTEFLPRFFLEYVPENGRRSIAKVLDLLSGGITTFLLTGYWQAFNTLSREQREAVFLKWTQSYIPLFRALYHGFKVIIIYNMMRTSPKALAAMEYPLRDPENDHPERFLKKEFYEFKFEDIDGKEQHDVEIETDVVVVGSGCGGGVAASILAQGGQRVMIIEKGEAYIPSEMGFTESEASEKLYENGGVLSTTDMNGNMLIASTWGGGSTVNWSASFPLPGKVRAEWAEEHGLDFVETEDFQDATDRVLKRMGVSTEHVRHNIPNTILLEGSKKIGYNCATVPQNTGGKEHYCGYCGWGCRFGEKQGGMMTWLVDAQKAGAKCIKRCQVDTIILDESGSKAIGVRARTSKGTKLVVKAKKVVLAGGSLHSPAILQRSGVKNKNIGKNMRVHNGIITYAIFNDRETRPWEGGILTAMTTEHDNLDGKGYGPKIHIQNLHPALGMGPYRGMYKQMAATASIVRDRDASGTVIDVGTNVPRVDYNPSKFDRESMLMGAIDAAKILVAAGADQVIPGSPGAPKYIVDKANPQNCGGIADPRFKAFIAALKKSGIGSLMATAHVMGTCKMGCSAQTSVVDTTGKVWGIDSLYIADASVFPTGSGVNPMITVMAMADVIARNVLQDLQE